MALNDDDITTTPPGPGPEGPADGGAVPSAHDGGADGSAVMDEGTADGGANIDGEDGGADGGADGAEGVADGGADVGSHDGGADGGAADPGR